MADLGTILKIKKDWYFVTSREFVAFGRYSCSTICPYKNNSTIYLRPCLGTPASQVAQW